MSQPQLADSTPVYDLHSHSRFSDGDLNPQELVALAVERNVTHLALTDHDSVAGLESAAEASAASGLSLVNGVEFSCQWNGQLLHMLGLNINPSHPKILEGVERNKQLRLERAEAMHHDFIKHGLDLRDEVNAVVDQAGVPTRPHFAQALINLGVVRDKNQAFKRYLVRGKVGYIPMQWPELAEVAQWIVESNGVGVLAHPMRYKFTRTKLIRLINDMQSHGVNALEVTTPVTLPQQSKMLTELCLKFDLLASTGSDFHSPSQPWAQLGTAAPLDPQLRPVWSLF